MGSSRLPGAVPSYPNGMLAVTSLFKMPSIRSSKMNVSMFQAVLIILLISYLFPVANYNPDRPVLSHFTQVVWKATTQVGCASKQCEGLLEPNVSGRAGTGNLLDGTYYVCLYTPPGNVVGGEK